MTTETNQAKGGVRSLPRKVWAASLTSFFNDTSTAMAVNILALFLSNMLGGETAVIALIEGLAESTASLLRVFSGWLSDRLQDRKRLAVGGHALSTLSKPFFDVANS